MVVASSMLFLRRLVMDNEFLALFPSSVLRFTPGICALPVIIKAQWHPLGILTVKHRTLSPLAKLFIECAHSVARDAGSAPLASRRRGSNGEKLSKATAVRP
jgi:DNA-binding transcriptional LysR family regulator